MLIKLTFIENQLNFYVFSPICIFSATGLNIKLTFLNWLYTLSQSGIKVFSAALFDINCPILKAFDIWCIP